MGQPPPVKRRGGGGGRLSHHTDRLLGRGRNLEHGRGVRRTAHSLDGISKDREVVEAEVRTAKKDLFDISGHLGEEQGSHKGVFRHIFIQPRDKLSEDISRTFSTTYDRNG